VAANPQIVDYIRRAAIARGIDPETALKVAGAEALNVFDPSQPDMGGDDRSSFGVFQLHYGGRSPKMPNAGLGDEFTARTGLRADDPSTWPQQVDFALDWAKKNGWGPWMGAARVGITGMQGINGAGGGGPMPTAPTTTASVSPMAPRDRGDPMQALTDALAMRDSLAAEETPAKQPESLLADTLAQAATPSGTGGIVADATDQETAMVPYSESLAPSAVPETPAPAEAMPQTDEAPTTGGLADLFDVKDIGIATEIDPYTGQPRPYRPRRAYG